MSQLLRRIRKPGFDFQLNVKIDCLHVPKSVQPDTVQLVMTRKGKKPAVSEDHFASGPDVHFGETLTTHITLHRDKNGEFEDKVYGLELRSCVTKRVLAHFSLNAAQFCGIDSLAVAKTLSNDGSSRGLKRANLNYSLSVTVSCKYLSSISHVDSDASSIDSPSSRNNLSNEDILNLKISPLVRQSTDNASSKQNLPPSGRPRHKRGGAHASEGTGMLGTAAIPSRGSSKEQDLGGFEESLSNPGPKNKKKQPKSSKPKNANASTGDYDQLLKEMAASDDSEDSSLDESAPQLKNENMDGWLSPVSLALSSPSSGNIFAHEQRLLRLEKELAEALSDRQRMSNEMEAMLRDNKKVTNELDALRMRVDDKAMEELNDELQSAKKENAKSKSFIDELSRKVTKMQGQRRNLTIRLEESLQIQREQSEKIDNLEKRAQEKAEPDIAVERLKTRLERTEQQMKRLDDQLVKALNERDDAMIELNAAVAENKQLREVVSLHRSDVNDQELNVNEQLNDALQQIAELKEQLDEVKNDRQSILDDLNLAIQICDQRADEMSTISMRMDEKAQNWEVEKIEVSRLQMQLTHSRQLAASLSKQLEEAQSDNHEISEKLRKMMETHGHQSGMFTESIWKSGREDSTEEFEYRQDMFEANQRISELEEQLMETDHNTLKQLKQQVFSLTLDKVFLTKAKISESNMHAMLLSKKEKLYRELQADLALKVEELEELRNVLSISKDRQQELEQEVESLESVQHELEDAIAALDDSKNEYVAVDKELKNALVKISHLEAQMTLNKGTARKLEVCMAEMEELRKQRDETINLLNKMNGRVEQLENESSNSSAELTKLRPVLKSHQSVKADMVDLQELLENVIQERDAAFSEICKLEDKEKDRKMRNKHSDKEMEREIYQLRADKAQLLATVGELVKKQPVATDADGAAGIQQVRLDEIRNLKDDLEIQRRAFQEKYNMLELEIQDKSGQLIACKLELAEMSAAVDITKLHLIRAKRGFQQSNRVGRTADNNETLVPPSKGIFSWTRR